MIPRIKSVKPMKDLCLEVTFETGDIRIMDIKPYMELFPVFRQLNSPAAFACVKVDTGGFGLVWNDEIDLDRCDVWEYGKPVQ